MPRRPTEWLTLIAWMILIWAILVWVIEIEEVEAHPTKRFDSIIQRSSALYLPGIPWRLWKSQLWAESRLRPDAISPAGAQGIAQFMPLTWKEVSQQLGWRNVSPLAAKPSILAGAYYMRWLRRFFKDLRDVERHWYAASAYNWGVGNILRVWKRKGKPVHWYIISKQVPRETRSYVNRIYLNWARPGYL